MTSGAGPGPLAGLCLYPGNNDQSGLILKIELPDLTILSFQGLLLNLNVRTVQPGEPKIE